MSSCICIKLFDEANNKLLYYCPVSPFFSPFSIVCICTQDTIFGINRRVLRYIVHINCSLNHKKRVEVANNAAINYYCCKEDNKTRKRSFSWFITQVFSSPFIFTFFRVLSLCIYVFGYCSLFYNRERFLIKRRLLGR